MLNNRTASSSVASFWVSFAVTGTVATVLIGVAAAQVPPAASSAPPAAGAAAEAANEPPTAAERLIDEAVKKIASLKSVSAELLQNVKMLNQDFSIKGRYLKGTNSRVYLRLDVSGLPDTTGVMLQVCDGETLWDFQQVFDSQIYRKKEIKPILELLNSSDIDDSLREQALAQMGFAGPETLLVGLRKTVKFDQREDGELDGKPVYILRGTWRDRSNLIGPDQQRMPLVGSLPPYMPSRVTLTLGKEDGWPYKLSLIGVKPSILTSRPLRKTTVDGRLATREERETVIPTEINLVYSNVRINPTIRVEEFAFQAPPGAKVEDDTEAIVKGLNQAIQAEAARKKVEAARKDGPLLPESIDVPSPPDGSAPR
jgi:outer membrane lipoprotein-sorting protein